MVGGGGRISSLERDGRGGAVRHRLGQGQAQLRGRGARTAGRALGRDGLPDREPAAGQKLEVVGPPAAGDSRQLLASGGRQQDLDGARGLPALVERAGERDARVSGNQGVVETARDLDALLGRRLSLCQGRLPPTR